jgi:tetratricopeptide (TPR) repeat protein
MAPEILGDLHSDLKDVFSALEAHQESLRCYRLAHLSGVHADILEALIDVGRCQKQVGDVDGSMASYSEACDVIRQMTDSPTQAFDLAKNMTEMVELFFVKGDMIGALQQCNDVIALCEGNDDVYFAALHRHCLNLRSDVHRALASNALRVKDYERVIDEYQLSLNDTSVEQNDLHILLNHSLGNLHHILLARGGTEASNEHHAAEAASCFLRSIACTGNNFTLEGVGVFTEYANFLIYVNKIQDSLQYLLTAVSMPSTDNQSCGTLNYDVTEMPTVSPALQDFFTFKNTLNGVDSVTINAKEYALFLMLLHRHELNLLPGDVEVYHTTLKVMTVELNSEVGVFLLSTLDL